MDTESKDNLYLNHREILIVEKFKHDIKMGNVNRTITQADVRIPVFVTLPVDSLKVRAVKIVRDLIKTVDNIKYLELPHILKCDLEESFNNKLKNCQVTDR